MTRRRELVDDPVFLLRGVDEEIYFIDDPIVIATLEVTVNKMKGKSEDEITAQLLRIINPERYGKVL